MIKITNRLSFLVLLSAIVSLTACKDDEELSNSDQLAVDIKKIEAHITSNDIQDVQKTESGLHYVISEVGYGDTAVVGSNVVVHYVGKLLNGSQFDSSVDRNEPFSFIVGQGRVIAGWDEGLQFFNEGAKGTLFIPSGLGYGPSGVSTIGGNEVLIFDVELLDFNISATQQLAEDVVEIEQYILDNNIENVQKTESGLHYVITTEGTGDSVSVGSTASVHYVGTFLKGEQFYSSIDEDEPFDFTFSNQFIKGWNEGIQFFNLGSKGKLFIPSTLAYGSAGASGAIDPNEILVYEIEILELN